MIRDEEDLLKSIQTHLKSNFNAALAEINTEKADFTTESITADDTHYLIMGEFSEIPNHSFVVVGIDGEIENLVIVDDLSQAVPIIIKVVFANQNRPNTYYKALRYMRALTEAMLSYEGATSEVAGLQITKSMPMVLELENRQLVTCGIALSVKTA